MKHKLNIIRKIFCIFNIFIYIFLVICLNIPKVTINQNNLNKKKRNEYNNIHVLMSLDNDYTYFTMSSIISLLYNSYNSTFVHYHFLVPDDYTQENKNKIYYLKFIKNETEMVFYHVGNMFNVFGNEKDYLGLPTYYRLGVQEIIKNIDKFIYLDADTIINDDIFYLYEIDMGDFYYKGNINLCLIKSYLTNNIVKDIYINAGVLLINAKKLREDKFFKVFVDKSKAMEYACQDQGIINEVAHNFIGYLPPKYGLGKIDRKKIKEIIRLTKNSKFKIPFKELKESTKKSYIDHYVGYKIGMLDHKIHMKNIEKTKYFKKIYNSILYYDYQRRLIK